VSAALGDADRGSDVAQADTGIPGDAEQDVSMVREEVPSGPGLSRCRCYLMCISRKIIHEFMIQSYLPIPPLERRESSDSAATGASAEMDSAVEARPSSQLRAHWSHS
jgi:hypothetical protein